MASPKKLSTLSDIRRLIGAPVTVETCGLRLRLTPPQAADALEVREKMFSSLEDGKPGGTMLAATALALKTCLNGMNLGEEEAMQLILRAGGERGKLAVQALELCGLGHILAGAEDGSRQGEDPVPFS